MKIFTVFLCVELSSFVSAFPDTRKQTVVHNANASSGNSSGLAISYSRFQSTAAKTKPSSMLHTLGKSNDIYIPALRDLIGNNRPNRSAILASSSLVAGVGTNVVIVSETEEKRSVASKIPQTVKMASSVKNSSNVQRQNALPIFRVMNSQTIIGKGDKGEGTPSTARPPQSVARNVPFARGVATVSPSRVKTAGDVFGEQEAAGSDVAGVVAAQEEPFGQESIRTVVLQRHVPYPVKVPVPVYVPQPYPVPVYTRVPYPVQTKVPYYIEKHVHHRPVTVRTPVRHVVVPVAKSVPMAVTKVRPVRVPYPVYVEKKVPVYVHGERDGEMTTGKLPVGSKTTGLSREVQPFGANYGSIQNLVTYANKFGGRYFPVKGPTRLANLGKINVPFFSGKTKTTQSHTSVPSVSLHGLKGNVDNSFKDGELDVHKGGLSTVSTASIKVPELNYIRNVGQELLHDFHHNTGYGYEVTDNDADASSEHIATLESPLFRGSDAMKNFDEVTVTPFAATSSGHRSLLKSQLSYSFPAIKVYDFDTKLRYADNTPSFQVLKYPLNVKSPDISTPDSSIEDSYAASRNHFSILKPPVLNEDSDFKLFDTVTKFSLSGRKTLAPVIKSPTLTAVPGIKIIETNTKMSHYPRQFESQHLKSTAGTSLLDSRLRNLEIVSLNVDDVKPIGGYGTVGRSVTFVSPGLHTKS